MSVLVVAEVLRYNVSHRWHGPSTGASLPGVDFGPMAHTLPHPTAPHAHDHAHHHGHGPGAHHHEALPLSSAALEPPGFSLLRASLALRLALALAVSSLIWLAVYAVLAVPA